MNSLRANVLGAVLKVSEKYVPWRLDCERMNECLAVLGNVS
jgi:hypothetical protein